MDNAVTKIQILVQVLFEYLNTNQIQILQVNNWILRQLWLKIKILLFCNFTILLQPWEPHNESTPKTLQGKTGNEVILNLTT